MYTLLFIVIANGAIDVDHKLDCGSTSMCGSMRASCEYSLRTFAVGKRYTTHPAYFMFVVFTAKSTIVLQKLFLSVY